MNLKETISTVLICERWNNETNSVNKFPKFTKIVNPYSLDKENNFIILN